MGKLMPYSTEYLGGAPCVRPARLSEVWELYHVEKGTVTVITAYYTAKVEAGTYFFLPDGVIRHIRGDGALSCVRFPSTVFRQISERVEKDLLYMFALRATQSLVKVDFFDPTYRAVEDAFRFCREELMDKDVCYDLRTSARIMLIFADILASYSAMTGEDGRPVYHNVLRLKPAIEYIHRHLYTRITVGELAGLLPLTADYFIRLFRESLGVTPVDYIQSARVCEAMRLLLETDCTIPEIAASVGISQSHMANLFGDILGMTPLAYRRLIEA